MLAIPADAPHPENALKFINYIMEPKVTADISNAVFYANGNKAAFAADRPGDHRRSRTSIRRPTSQAKLRAVCRRTRRISRARDPHLDAHQDRRVIAIHGRGFGSARHFWTKDDGSRNPRSPPTRGRGATRTPGRSSGSATSPRSSATSPRSTTSRSTSSRASCSACSAARGPASRRCCACSPASRS